MLKSGKTVVAPGVYDGMTARLVEKGGFAAAYASGGAIARGAGIPDLGLLSLAEIAARLGEIVDVVDLPVIADADNGYGNALNAQRTAHVFERAGVAALHLEDQTFPKRCGHYDDKAVVPVAEMAGKLKAVRDALHDADFVVIARTDAIAVEGFDAAIDRCHAYLEAGADVAFLDAPTSEAQIADIARRIGGWKLINMFHGGKTPLLPVSRLQELGFSIVIIPSDLQRAAIRAMQRTLAAIARDGSSSAILAELALFDEREALVGTAEFLARGKRYAQ
jgi:2-methylisocitrate lyase-like PEP mutase family enzyme